MALALRPKLGTGGAGFRHGGGEIDVDSGLTGVWRRHDARAAGRLGRGWPQNQDAELAARLRRAGGRIVCIPEMAASYVPRDDLRSLARQYWRYGLYRAKTSRRHPRACAAAHVLPPAATLSVLLMLLPGARGRLARMALAAYSLGVMWVSAGTLRWPGRDAGSCRSSSA